MNITLNFYGKHRCQLGESPLWDPREQRLYWVDSTAQLILSADAVGGSLQSWELPSIIGSIALAEPGLLVALQDGFYAFADGLITPLALPEKDNAGVRFNDGKADRQGRFLAGTMRHNGAEGSPGKVYRLDSPGTTVIERDFKLANALCFSPDGRTMYFADSLQSTIWAYDYDERGAVGRRVFLDTSPLGSVPDGATVDANGHLWVALVQGARLARIAPDGRVVEQIHTPMPFPSCPAFGGSDLATLYVTSIRSSGGLHTEHPDGGRILAITGLDTPGITEAICPIPAAEEYAA